MAHIQEGVTPGEPHGNGPGEVSLFAGRLVERFEPRTRVKLPVELFIDQASASACILDISSRGLMLQTNYPLKVCKVLEVRREGQSLVGSVRWVKGRRAGLRFGGRIVVQAYLRGDTDFTLVRPSAASRSQHSNLPLRYIADWVFHHFQWFALAVIVAGGALVLFDVVSEALSPLRTINLH